jgi:hypothetical protein
MQTNWRSVAPTLLCQMLLPSLTINCSLAHAINLLVFLTHYFQPRAIYDPAICSGGQCLPKDLSSPSSLRGHTVLGTWQQAKSTILILVHPLPAQKLSTPLQASLLSLTPRSFQNLPMLPCGVLWHNLAELLSSLVGLTITCVSIQYQTTTLPPTL